MFKFKKDLLIIIIVLALFGIGYFASSFLKESESEPVLKNLSRSEKLDILSALSTTTPSTSMSAEEKKKILEDIGKQSTISKSLSSEEKIKTLNSLTK